MQILLATVLLSFSYKYPQNCDVDYRRYPYELFETADMYLAGPPEQHSSLNSADDVRILVDFLRDISPFVQSGIDDDSLILGFIELQPSSERLVITETSIFHFGCVKKLSDEQWQSLMSIFHHKETAE